MTRPSRALCGLAALAGMLREHRLGINDTEPVATATHGCKTRNCVVRFGASPIPLKLEQILERRHWLSAGLHHPFNSSFMGFLRNITASVRDHVDLKTLIDRRKRRSDDTHRSPQA